MEISIYDAKTHFSKLIQSIIDGSVDAIVISKNGKPVAQLTPIAKKNSKRIGVAKKNMGNFDISLEDFNAIPVEDYGI